MAGHMEGFMNDSVGSLIWRQMGETIANHDPAGVSDWIGRIP